MNEPQDAQVLWTGKFLRIIKSGRWEYADRVGSKGGVVIVPLTNEGNIILIEQFRIPVRQRVIEFPAGLAGDNPAAPTEELSAAATRELLEETGYEAGQMTWLTSGPPSAGLASEIITFFRATNLRRINAGLGDGHEQIEVHEIPLTSVEKWLQEKSAASVLIDPKVYAGLFFLDHFCRI